MLTIFYSSIFFSAQKVAQLFAKDVLCLQGVHTFIVGDSDRDLTFITKFSQQHSWLKQLLKELRFGEFIQMTYLR